MSCKTAMIPAGFVFDSVSLIPPATVNQRSSTVPFEAAMRYRGQNDHRDKVASRECKTNLCSAVGHLRSPSSPPGALKSCGRGRWSQEGFRAKRESSGNVLAL